MAILPAKKNEPVRLLSEEDVKKFIGVEDFRHVTKNQVVQLVSSLSQMDPEVAKRVIEQVPEMGKIALGMAQELKESYESSLKANEASSSDTLKQINAIIDILSEQLKNDGVTPEERIHIYDCLNSLADKSVEVHRLNQDFIKEGLRIVAGFAGFALIGIGAVLGTNGKFELPDLRR
ncbi:hypothetical protein [Olsenella phocaeensis]|uniref:hypothetical protein n=1 Tax=Olsenella phocaeensis TaxID=1852385 RepID=UPI003A9558C4